MNNNGFNNGNDRYGDTSANFIYELDEPIHIKGFSVTHDRKFNLGNFESLAPAIAIWAKTTVAEGESYDLHHAKERLRRMARENVRAQLWRLQGNPEAVFLGLQPPADGRKDPIFIRTVSVSLAYKVNLGGYNSIVPSYTDWADVRHVSHSPGELHIALERMWTGLWNNMLDEISRAQGNGSAGTFFGLPPIEVEDLTPVSQANGHFDKPNTVGPLSAGRVPATNGSGT
jgi:hypothetical protein